MNFLDQQTFGEFCVKEERLDTQCAMFEGFSNIGLPEIILNEEENDHFLEFNLESRVPASRRSKIPKSSSSKKSLAVLKNKHSLKLETEVPERELFGVKKSISKRKNSDSTFSIITNDTRSISGELSIQGKDSVLGEEMIQNLFLKKQRVSKKCRFVRNMKRSKLALSNFPISYEVSYEKVEGLDSDDSGDFLLDIDSSCLSYISQSDDEDSNHFSDFKSEAQKVTFTDILGSLKRSKTLNARGCEVCFKACGSVDLLREEMNDFLLIKGKA